MQLNALINELFETMTPLRLLHIFPLVAIFHRQKFIQLFTIHILTYVSIFVHLRQYSVFVRTATLCVTLNPEF